MPPSAAFVSARVLRPVPRPAYAVWRSVDVIVLCGAARRARNLRAHAMPCCRRSLVTRRTLLPRRARELHQASDDQVQAIRKHCIDRFDDSVGARDLQMRERLARFAERDVKLRL